MTNRFAFLGALVVCLTLVPACGAHVQRPNPDQREKVSSPLEQARLRTKSAVNAVAFSHDGTLLAAACADKLWLWHRNGSKWAEYPVAIGARGPILSVAFSPDDTRLACSAMSGDVEIAESGRFGTVVYRAKSVSGYVSAVAFGKDSSEVVFGQKDGAIMLWTFKGRDAPVPSKVASFQSAVLTIARHPDGAWFAGGARDGSVKVWDANFVKVDSPGLKFESRVTAIAFDANSRLAVGSLSGLVQVYAAKEAPPEDQGQVTSKSGGNGIRWECMQPHQIAGSLLVPVYSLDLRGDTLAVSYAGGKVLIWRPPTDPNANSRKPQKRRVHSVDSDIYTLAFDDNCSRLAAGTKDGSVYIWSMDDMMKLPEKSPKEQ